MKLIGKRIKINVRRQLGQGMTEYIMIVALIAVASGLRTCQRQRGYDLVVYQ
jgi:hypothetical protein